MIQFHPAARRELLAAEKYYARIHVNLAKSFREEVESALKKIEAGPEKWPCGEFSTRRYLLNRFPYAVVYDIGESEIRIVAVAHGKRKPGYWKRRVPRQT